MDNREWERFGEEIRRNVQDAVDSRDFSRLNQTITDAINGAADGISRGMRDAAGEFTRSVRGSVPWNGSMSKRRNAYKNQNQYQGAAGQDQAQWQQGSNMNRNGTGAGQGMYGQPGAGYGYGSGQGGYGQPGQGAASGTYNQPGQGTASGTYSQPGQGAAGETYSQSGQGTAGGTYNQSYGQTAGYGTYGGQGFGSGTYDRQGQNASGGAQGQYDQRYNWNKAYYSRFGNRDKQVDERGNSYTGQKENQEKQLPALYAKTVPAKIGGTMLFGMGCAAGSISLIGLATILLAGFGTGDLSASFWVASGGAAVCAAGFGCMAGAGSGILGRVKRFRSYIRSLGSREYCNVRELSEHLGKSPRYIVKDLEKMIQKGWFKQGHFDKQKTCLMVSDNAYKQYTDLMLQTEQMKTEQKAKEDAARKRAKEVQKQAEEPDSDLPPEVRKIIRTGEKYIRKIHACNDAIPEKEISAKISRMELLVDRIFDRVEQNPELVTDINRMMDYYLPTTVKLLEAYEDLDAEPVQGENIISSKKEIEKTLDTLNVAFEKLLDSLFQDTAWDVSSDISVLEMMLAQEGLTKDDFKEVH